MQNFVEKAVTEFGQSHTPHLIATMSTDVPEALGGPAKNLGYLMAKSSEHVELQQEALVRIQPRTAVNSAAVLNAGIVEFLLNKSQISRLEELHLKLDITNSTGAAVTLSPIRAMIQQIEIFGNQGGQLLNTQRYTELYFELQHYNSNDYALRDLVENMTTPYSPLGRSLANTASTQLYLPIWTLIDGGNLHLAGLESDVMVRVTFQPSTFTIQSGTHPTVNAVELIAKGYYEKPSVMKAKLEYYKNNRTIIKYLDSQIFTISQAFAASSSYKFTLSSVSGLVAYLWIGLRPAARTAANQTDFTVTNGVLNYDILDRSGHSISGSYPRTQREAKYIVYPQRSDNQMSLNTEAIFHPFCSDPTRSFRTGANTGFHAFDGVNQLVLNTSGTFVPGNYELVVSARIYNHAIIEKNSIKRVN